LTSSLKLNLLCARARHQVSLNFLDANNLTQGRVEKATHGSKFEYFAQSAPKLTFEVFEEIFLMLDPDSDYLKQLLFCVLT
jgi:hypothetical protein